MIQFSFNLFTNTVNRIFGIFLYPFLTKKKTAFNYNYNKSVFDKKNRHSFEFPFYDNYSKHLIFFLFAVSISFTTRAQISENIQSWNNQTPYVASFTQTISAGTVTLTQCGVVNTGYASGVTAGTCSGGYVQMKGSTGVIELPTLTSVGSIEVHLAAGAASRTLKLQYYNGSSWVDLTTWSGIGTTGATFTYTYNNNASTQLRLATPSNTVYVHDIIVTLYGVPLTICTPIGNLDCTVSDYISNVTINTLNNTTTCGSGGYTVYAATGAQTTSLTAGNSYNLTISSGSGTGTHTAGVWIDFNSNGIFETTEYTLISSSIAPSTTTSPVSIAIPAGAIVGTVRMRVRYFYSTPMSNSVACVSSGTYGETEDYTVTIASATPPTIALSTNNIVAGNIAQGSNNNPIYSFAIGVTVSSATLSGLTVTTNGGYASADITNLKAWYQTSAQGATFTGTGTLLSTLTTPGTAGLKTFPSFTSQSIASGATGYIFITADVPCSATSSAIIGINAVTGTNTTFTSGTPTGTPAAGNNQTVSTATPVNVTGAAASIANASSAISWTNPTGCYTEIMIVAAPASNTGTPSGNGSAYTANLTYTSGTALGNGYVVYKGATSPQTIAGLTNGVPYYFKIFTRLGTVWSSGVEVTATPGISFCASTGTASASSAYLTSFSTTGGTTNVTNNSSGYSANGYGDFTSTQTVTKVQSGTVNFSTTIFGISGGVGVGIWVDWNQNGDFTDAGENVYNTTGSYAYANPSGSFSVPAGATVGNTRMRVVVNYYSNTPLSCNSVITGETEDYKFTVTSLPSCSTPGAQPTSLSFSSVTSTTLSGSFSAVTPTPPSGYIVLRSTTNTNPVAVNGTTYNVGTAYTLPTVSYTVVTNSNTTTFSQTGLAANTKYYYFVLSYNSGCGGQPYFLNTTPLKDSVLTCTAASASLSGSAASTVSATITFGTITGATSYVLQYSVAGANSWSTASPAPTASPYTLTGLTAGTAYDIRIQGPNSNCGTLLTASSAFTTPCTNLTLTVTQGFEAGTTIPSCWTQQYINGTKDFKYGTAAETGGTSPLPAAATGTRRLFYPSYSNNGRQTRFYSPPITTTGTSSVDVQFNWYFSDNGGATSYLTEGVQVQWSTNGTTWTDVGSLIRRYGPTTGWSLQTITLPAGAGNIANLYVGFVFTSNAGYDSYMDDIVVKATPVCSANSGGTAATSIASICGTSGSATLTATGYSSLGSGLTYQWEYSLSPTFASGIFNLPSGNNPATASTGTISTTTYYRLKVTCSATGTSYSNIVSVSIVNPAVLTTTPASRCGVGTVTLGATASAGTTPTWYAAASGGSSLGTGTGFTTPVINATTNYYVSAASAGSNIGSVGPVTPSAQGGTIATQTINWRVYFDVTVATTLQSVDVFPVSSGESATLYVFDAGGTLLKSVGYTTSVSGGSTAQTIPINLVMATGTGYNIYASTIPTSGLKRNESAAVYPYTSSAINITGNGFDATYFMCYYNWKFSTGCESGRTLVTATVTAPPAIALDSSTLTICNGNSGMVNVTAGTKNNFDTYSWAPSATAVLSGTPTGSTATLSPTVTTTYTVSGTKTSTGCVNTATVTVTVNPAAPVTTAVTICSGGSGSLTASSSCSLTTLAGTTINGSWNSATDPVAIQPVIFLPNSSTCEFSPDGRTQNYTTLNFQVSVTGTYTFTMAANTNYDGMGYIVTGAFVPGVCPGTGTWVVGDDDSGPSSLEPLMTASLTAGVVYTLITTCYTASSGTTTDSYIWNITPPAGGQLSTVQTGTLQWFTTASGGTAIGTGTPFNPIGVAGSGIATNTSTGVYTFYAGCSNNPTCRTATTYVIGAPGQWIGGTSTAWANAANWCGGVPSLTTDGTILAGTPYSPLVGTGIAAVKKLTVNTGAFLTVSAATLQVADSIKATNAITAINGTIELAGSTTQTISGSSFTGKEIKNLVISNNVNVASTANDTLRINGTLSFGGSSKAFNSNDNVTIVSTATGTGRIADITNGGANSGNSIAGKFVIERYIPARRAWRLLTAPISSSQTISAAWQEGGKDTYLGAMNNPKPGYGTHITGGSVNNGVNGYDFGPNSASIFSFNGTSWNQLPVSGTSGTDVNAKQGWMLFVRGDRSTNLSQAVAAVTSPSVLRTKGNIFTGTKTISSLVSGFNVIGNPYASTINFKNLVLNTVNDAYYLWDPNIPGAYQVGGFVTFSGDGSHNGVYVKSVNLADSNKGIIPGDGTIQSGAAFLVKSPSAGGSITFNENNKVATSNNLQFRPVPVVNQLRTTLFTVETGTNNLLLNDGNVICYQSNYSNDIDHIDAEKPNNFLENFGIASGGKKIAVERRSLLTLTDTVFYEMWKMRQRNYRLEFVLDKITAPIGTAAFLEDLYLQTKTPVSMYDTTRIDFSITADAGSAMANRFRLVFNKSADFDFINAFKLNRDIQVEWGVNREFNMNYYVVERSLNNINFTPLFTKPATYNNQTFAAYNWLDKSPQTGQTYYYRIKSVSVSGIFMYSKTVKVTLLKAVPDIYVFPNPIRNNAIQLQLNELPTGVYFARLLNAAGQTIFTSTINHTTAVSTEIIRVETKLPKATYQLEITGKGINKKVISVVVDE